MRSLTLGASVGVSLGAALLAIVTSLPASADPVRHQPVFNPDALLDTHQIVVAPSTPNL